MKLIIAGTRDMQVTTKLMHEMVELMKAEHRFDHIDTILSGKAPGIDACGERYAHEYNIPVEPHPAKWGEYGKAAGPYRNREMAQAGDALLLVWNGTSRGSRNMLNEAMLNQIAIGEFQWNDEEADVYMYAFNQGNVFRWKPPVTVVDNETTRNRPQQT